MLYNFPPAQQTQTGQMFWSGPKRCPSVLVFDINDSLHVDYIFAAANLKAEIYGLAQLRDRDAVLALVQTVEVSFTTKIFNFIIINHSY